MSRVIERRDRLPLVGLGRAGRFLWEAAWLPFWLGSTMPPPALPARDARPAVAGERSPRILGELDALRDTIWRQRRAILALRALWLALAVLDGWLLLRVVAHRPAAFGPFLLASLALLIGGAFLIATARPSRAALARTLDRSFGLRERVATAYETASDGGRLRGIRALQVLDATQIARQVGGARAFRPRLPLREIVPAAALAIVGLVLLVFLLIQRGGPGGAGNGPGGGNAPGGNAAGQQGGNAPGQQPGNQNTQGGQNGQQPGGNRAGSQGDLNTVAGALQGNGATQQAGDQLANGNAAGAAQALREAAQRAGQLSPQERQALAADLREAAGKVGDQQLAQDLIAAANALQQPNAAGAQQALNQVADDIARLGGDQGQNGGGNQPGQQGQQGPNAGDQPGGGNGSGSGAGAPQLPSGQRAQPSTGPATEPPGANGQPVQLPKGNANQGTINTQNQNGRGTGPTDPGNANAGGGQLRQGTVGESGVDPNQVPFEQRGTVQQYFTPPPPKSDE